MKSDHNNRKAAFAESVLRFIRDDADDTDVTDALAVLSEMRKHAIGSVAVKIVLNGLGVVGIGQVETHFPPLFRLGRRLLPGRFGFEKLCRSNHSTNDIFQHFRR